MSDKPASAKAEKTSAQRFYKEERVADPQIGCVDFNALHDELAAAAEAKPAKSAR